MEPPDFTRNGSRPEGPLRERPAARTRHEPPDKRPFIPCSGDGRQGDAGLTLSRSASDARPPGAATRRRELAVARQPEQERTPLDAIGGSARAERAAHRLSVMYS
jgi:hypothetical protein